ncbi:MAG TPA: helix-turn-helix domain-containing protein [Roseiflexaceae bacterium]|nr:helix-turn-helix domain-containing protein [Roseiflexaceae bacterium]
MSPRRYRLGERESTIQQTRDRIIGAARALLTTSDGFTSFSIEAVARQANVARMTVYYQFGSKVGLLEAICDTMAVNGGITQLGDVFRLTDPHELLARYVQMFSQFWDSDRLLSRRLRGLAALDPEFELVIRARDERRRRGAEVLVQRLAERTGRPAPNEKDQNVDLLFTLTSFDTFDTLAGSARACADVAPLVQRLVKLALDL